MDGAVGSSSSSSQVFDERRRRQAARPPQATSINLIAFLSSCDTPPPLTLRVLTESPALVIFNLQLAGGENTLNNQKLF